MTMNPAPIHLDADYAAGTDSVDSETLVCKAVRTALMHHRPPQ